MPPGQSFDESQAAALPTPPAFPPPQLQAQNSGVRVPPLTPDRVADYTRLFESGGVPKGGTLDGNLSRSTRPGNWLTGIQETKLETSSNAPAYQIIYSHTSGTWLIPNNEAHFPLPSLS